MLKKPLITATIFALGVAFAPGPAAAGDASWKYSDGTRIKIKCRNSGCTVKAKSPGGKWVVVEKGKGGSDNFDILEAKYKKQKPQV